MIEFLVQHKEKYAPFIEKPFEEYVDYMKKPGAWGDHLELQIISEVFNCRIEIFHLTASPIVIYGEKEYPELILRLFYKN